MRYKSKDRFVEGWPVRYLLDLAQRDWAALPEPIKKAYEEGTFLFGSKSVWVSGVEAKTDIAMIQMIDSQNVVSFITRTVESWNSQFDEILPRTIEETRSMAVSSLLALPPEDADLVISSYREQREAARVASASENGVTS